MSDKLFSIRCETCGSRLAVRDACLIGHILSCPKCSSMVMVQPPEDWSPSAAPASSDAPPAGSSAPSNAAVSASAAVPASAAGAATAVAAPQAGLDSTTAAEAAALRDRWADAASIPPPPSQDATADVPLPAQDWLSPRQRFLRVYGVKIGAAVVGIAATVGVWNAFSPPDPSPDPTASMVETTESVVKPAYKPAEAPTPDAEAPAVPTVPPESENPIETSHSDAPRATEPDPPAVAGPSENVAQGPTATPTVPPDNPANEIPAAEIPPRPERDPLPVIDVAARLNDPILKLDYDKVPLVDFLGVMSKFSSVPISLDVDALIAAGVRPELPVHARSANKTTVGEALSMALAKPKLRYVVVDQHILVTTAESAAPSTPARRDVGDLVGGDAAGAERLAQLVKQLVEPVSWQTERTTTSLRIDGSALVIVHSPRVVRKIDSLLAAIRAARLDPMGVAVAPPPTLQTRHYAAREALGKKIILNYTTPTSFEKIVARLSEASKLTVIVNWQALANDNVGPQTETRMVASDVSVEKAFSALVEPMQLAYRIVDGHTVEITTLDELAGHPELAAFPLADLAADEAKLAAIVGLVKQQFGGPVAVDANSAASNAAAPHAAAAIDAGIAWHLDESSKTLFLLAPQDTLIQLEAVFAQARTK